MNNLKLKETLIGLGIVANGVLYLVIIFMWLSIPDETLLNGATTAFNLFLSALLIILKRQRFKVFYESNQFKLTVDTLVNGVLVFFILALLNFWSFKYPWQKDFSLFQLNTLTAQTKEVVSKVDGPLEFKVFARKNEAMLWMPILDLYRFVKSDIKIEKINIELRPDLVSQYNIQNDSTLVIEYKGRRQFVTTRDELNVTNAIIRLTRLVDPVIYFVVGHGEADIESSENEGMKLVLESVRNTAIDVRPLNLSSAQEIPFDAKAVIVWGPKTPFMDSELAILKRYFQRGGGLVFALDPDLNERKFTNVENFLSEIGLIYHHNLIYDRKNFVNGSNGSVPIASTFLPDHILTKDFKGQIFFPLASSVGIRKTEDSTLDLKELVFSSEAPQSWGETDKKEIASEAVFYTEGKDRPGPLSFIVSAEGPKNRILLFGNSSFALNAYVKFSSNMNFFINTMSWIVGEDRLVSFNLPIIQSEQIFISDNQLGVVFYFSVIFAPLLLIVLSIYIYRRRRAK